MARVDESEKIATQVGKPPSQNGPAAAERIMGEPTPVVPGLTVLLLKNGPTYSGRFPYQMHQHELPAEPALKSKRRSQRLPGRFRRVNNRQMPITGLLDQSLQQPRMCPGNGATGRSMEKAPNGTFAGVAPTRAFSLLPSLSVLDKTVHLAAGQDCWTFRHQTFEQSATTVTVAPHIDQFSQSRPLPYCTPPLRAAVGSL
jgi:hypothetical protein